MRSIYVCFVYEACAHCVHIGIYVGARTEICVLHILSLSFSLCVWCWADHLISSGCECSESMCRKRIQANEEKRNVRREKMKKKKKKDGAWVEKETTTTTTKKHVHGFEWWCLWAITFIFKISCVVCMPKDIFFLCSFFPCLSSVSKANTTTTAAATHHVRRCAWNDKRGKEKKIQHENIQQFSKQIYVLRHVFNCLKCTFHLHLRCRSHQHTYIYIYKRNITRWRWSASNGANLYEKCDTSDRDVPFSSSESIYREWQNKLLIIVLFTWIFFFVFSFFSG